jgi:Flp pilus assembly protein TadB
VTVWPGRFDPAAAQNMADVVGLLRRAGYPYNTPGEFYAAAIRTFSLYLALGGFLAGTLFFLGWPLPGLALAGIFIFLGLRQPYSRLKGIARRRAAAMRDNMLTGLAMLNALISAGVGVQEALRRTAAVGGPFCNLLGLLIARMEVDDFVRAVETTRAHMPDPADVEAGLFLRDVEDYFVRNRPLLSGVQALQEAVHRNLVETTEARAGLVRQRSGLFGILAVVGLLVSLIAPFAGVFF